MNARRVNCITVWHFYLLLPALALVLLLPDWIIPQPSHPAYVLEQTGKWSYPLALAPYYALLMFLAWKYQVILQFATWKFFFCLSVGVFLVLGLFFELLADVLYVWSFPSGRDLFLIRIPIFGWFTGHRIPVSEFLWILGVVPLFYYLYLWATLVFYDIIYVVDAQGQTYKKEERWVGFHGTTRILTRPKGMKDRRHETELLRREPGFIARNTGGGRDD